MRSTRPIYFTILPVLLLLLTPFITVRADDEEAPDEYDVTDRVARISFVAGDVKLKRSGSNETENARVNLPLVEGDLLTTALDARAEIQIDARNFIRIGGDSELQITTLREEGIALSLSRGIATIRLAKFDHDKQYFEIDAPKTTLAAETEGLYRVEISSEGRVMLTARSGGRARIYSQTSGFVLRDGRTAELINDGPEAGDWEFSTANAADTWDTWVDERERFLAERMQQTNRYYDNYLWGAEDLDAYGTWNYVEEYGWMWRPNDAAISSYNDWAPYRYGNWTYLPPYGWSWVGYEPWGWAPYHYGRWVYYNHYWAWCPRTPFNKDRSWWRPALVAFVTLNVFADDTYCWYPLHYHQKDPCSRNYHRDRDHWRDHDHDGDRHRGHDNYRGVTYVPRRDFGNGRGWQRPADDALAQRVVVAQPLATNLPLRPTMAGLDTPALSDRSINRVPRSTGADTRRPGVALDNELRHSRIFNGRDMRPEIPPASGGAGPGMAQPMGAVPRQGQRERPRDPRDDGGRDANRDSGDSERPVTNIAPVRTEPPRRDPRDDGGRDANPDSDQSDRPIMRERNETRPPAPVRVEHRNDPPPRIEPPRNDPPRIEPPHNDPPRNDPPPRDDPPRSDPPPRNDPPPRSDPPPRNDPPAERHDAPSRDKPPR